jgi:hypothetical protein
MVGSSSFVAFAQQTKPLKAKPPVAKAPPKALVKALPKAPASVAKVPGPKPTLTKPALQKSAPPKVATPPRAAVVESLGVSPGSVLQKIVVYRLGTRVRYWEAPALAVSSGELVAAFDVVAPLVDSQRDLQLAVETPSGVVTGTLAEIDVLNNLALIRVPSGSLTRFFVSTQIRSSWPQIGEALDLYAFPKNSPLTKWSTAATGLISDGLLAGFGTQMGVAEMGALPRGALFFDRQGRFAGAAKVGRRAPLVLGHSSAAVNELLARAARGPASSPLRAQGVNQFSQIQNHWLNSSLDPQTSMVTFLRGWNLNSTPRAFDCENESVQINDRRIKSQVTRVESQKCSSPVPVSGADWLYSDMQIISGVVQTKWPNPSPEERQALAAEVSAPWRKAYEDQVSDARNFSSMDCQTTTVLNSRFQEVVVEFCTAAHMSAVGLYDWFI